MLHMTASKNPIKLTVLISGGGRTLQNIHDQIQGGHLDATIDRVISSKQDVAGIERARNAGLDVIVIERKSLDIDAFQQRLTDAIGNVDLVCMAGFLSLWKIPDAMTGKVINIHPALLPEFGGKGMYGTNVHKAVLKAGKKESGCTVHFCDNHYDHGPILLQRKVLVETTDTPDTLAARVFQAECIAYPEAIGQIASGSVTICGRDVLIEETPPPPTIPNTPNR
jgi:phosphoribosylglycinamide formyltransferase 1